MILPKHIEPGCHAPFGRKRDGGANFQSIRLTDRIELWSLTPATAKFATLLAIRCWAFSAVPAPVWTLDWCTGFAPWPIEHGHPSNHTNYSSIPVRAQIAGHFDWRAGTSRLCSGPS